MLTDIIASIAGWWMTIIWSLALLLTSIVRISAKLRLGTGEGVAPACEDSIFCFLFFMIQVVLSPRGGGTVTDTYHDGASFMAPFHCSLYISICFVVLFLWYKKAELPRVTIQKPDRLSGYLRHHSTAFGLLRCFRP
jgi:hypothetical protein